MSPMKIAAITASARRFSMTSLYGSAGYASNVNHVRPANRASRTSTLIAALFASAASRDT